MLLVLSWRCTKLKITSEFCSHQFRIQYPPLVIEYTGLDSFQFDISKMRLLLPRF
jgi:hypothetical protein